MVQKLPGNKEKTSVLALCYKKACFKLIVFLSEKDSCGTHKAAVTPVQQAKCISVMHSVNNQRNQILFRNKRGILFPIGLLLTRAIKACFASYPYFKWAGSRKQNTHFSIMAFYVSPMDGIACDFEGLLYFCSGYKKKSRTVLEYMDFNSSFATH